MPGSLATITTISRNTIANTNHKEIDAILKDLRFCSRHLKSALNGFEDELLTLERLYYKCRNQHRAALFFKRVTEIRRYGRRLCVLDIAERVDLLRASFVGLTHTKDQKALRSTWTHVPEKPHISCLTETLTTGSALVCKMRERLENAYHHFTLAMQTGAFIQTVILLAALSSRMSVLSSQIDEALQSSLSTCDRLLVTTHPIGTDKTISQQLPSEPETLHSHIDHDVPPEDTGQAVVRRETTVEEQGPMMEATLEVPVAPTLGPGHPTDARDHITVSVRKVQKPRLKKAKKKLDEIDEIFGF